MKKKKCITNVIKDIEDKEDFFLADSEEFAKKFKHLIEGICKIDDLKKKLKLSSKDNLDGKLDLEKWDDSVYNFFCTKILELIQKYTFDIFEKSIPSRKTKIINEKLYPSNSKGMMLIMELRLLLFEIAAMLNEEVKDRDYYNQLYHIRLSYYRRFSEIYNKEMKEAKKEYKKKKRQNKQNEKIDSPYNIHGRLLEICLSIMKSYFEEFLKISLKTNEFFFPYDLDYLQDELYYECKSEYLKNPGQDLDDLIHKCKQRLIRRDLGPDIDLYNSEINKPRLKGRFHPK